MLCLICSNLLGFVQWHDKYWINFLKIFELYVFLSFWFIFICNLNHFAWNHYIYKICNVYIMLYTLHTLHTHYISSEKFQICGEEVPSILHLKVPICAKEMLYTSIDSFEKF